MVIGVKGSIYEIFPIHFYLIIYETNVLSFYLDKFIYRFFYFIVCINNYDRLMSVFAAIHW